MPNIISFRVFPSCWVAGLGLAVSAISLIGLIAMLWVRRGSSLIFQVALSVVVTYLLLPEEAYSAPILIIPAIWVADNARRSKTSGAANQLALAAVRLALWQLWLATVVAALLLHTNAQGKAAAWWFPVNAVFPVFASLLLILVLQVFQVDGLSEVNGVVDGNEVARTAT